MRKWVKALLITGLCILGAGIAACIIAFALNGFRLWRNPIPAPSGSSETRREELHEIITEDFSDIIIDTVTCDVDIRKSPNSECRLDYTYTPVSDHSEVICKVENGTLIFRHVYQSANVRWWDVSRLWKQLTDLINNVGIFDGGSHLVVYLPEKEYGELNIDLTTGDLDITEVAASNIITDLTTGNIKISDIQTAGLEAELTTGNIALDGISSTGKTVLSVVTGDLSITNSVLNEAEINGTTSDIYVENLEANKLKASTVTGDITGKIASDINVQCSVVTGDSSAPSGSRGHWEISAVTGDIKLQNISN